MRFFPSAARQRLAVASVAGAVTLGLLTSPLARADDPAGHRQGHADGHSSLKHRRSEVSGQIHSATTDLDDASKQIVAATRSVQHARARLEAARSHLAGVHARLADAQDGARAARATLETARARLADANAALSAGQAAVADQREQVKDNVIGVLTQGDPQLDALTSLSRVGSLDDYLRELSAQTIISNKSDAVYDGLTEAEVSLTTQQAAVESATHEVADRSRAAAARVEAVRSIYAEAQEAKKDVADLVARTVAAKQHAFEVRAHDRQVLSGLRRREARINRQILALAAKEARQSGGVTGAGDGFLTYPAAGYPVTSPYGYRVHPIYGYYSLHNGDDFGVPCGTQLHAVADGTIISEYSDSVWGNRIFLSLGRVNGHNMTVIYNHMSKFFSAQGEHVQRGQVIGLSGTTGWSTGCHLHFTVMVDGVAVDPMKYL